MPIDESLNKILKEIWRIDEKNSNNQDLNAEEKEFFNQNLYVIQKYYDDNKDYWERKTKI